MSNVEKMDRFAALLSEGESEVELQENLLANAFAIGGTVCYFPAEERAKIISQIINNIGMGFKMTSKQMENVSEH